jgi:hypothetical protein
MVSLPSALELDEVLVRQIVGDVGVAALEQRAPVAGVGHHAPDDALDLRQRAAFQVSLRSKTTSVPAVQLVTL